MVTDRSFVEQNRAATERIRALAALPDDALRVPVGEHWTVAIRLPLLASWHRRVLAVLDDTERAGRLTFPQIDFTVNDIALPFWATMPPRAAADLAAAAAEALDQRLATFPPALLAELHAHNERWVVRALHRNAHLDEVDAALATA